MSWDEVLVAAQRPYFVVALSVVRVRFMTRAPRALLGLSQVAGTEWNGLFVADLSELQLLLTRARDQLPPPCVDSHQWFDLAAQCPVQWRQFIQRFFN